MAEITLTIDGQEVKAEAGMTVLEAAQEAGIYVPTLCADADLKPYGGCRLCIVEIEKMRGFPTACTTPVTEGMVVTTNTEAVNEIRHTVVELLLSDHPSECLICHRRKRCGPFDICLRNVAVTERCVSCAKNEHCELQDIVDYLGITELPFKYTGRAYPVDTSNPFYYRDLTKCVLCTKCVRICDEVLGVGALAIMNRGFNSKVATFGDKPVLNSNCVSCGECVVHCPVGALMPKVTELPDKEVATTCTYCGVGCGLYLGVKDGKVMSVRGKREGTVNNGFLCVRGRFRFDFIHREDRLTSPLIKKDGRFVRAGWDEALELVASKLGKYKPDELAVVASAKGTNEDNYVAQKFARAVLKTNNIDQYARLYQAHGMDGLVQSFGSGEMTNSFNEFRDAGCILAIGTDTTEDHPIISLELKRAVDNGAKLIVADSREIDMVRWSHLWLRPKPGSDAALLMGMMRVIVDEGRLDKAFIDKRCENFDAFKKSLKDFDLNTVERITGVPKEKIAEAARLYAIDKPSAILYGKGNASAIANLAMLTGNIGKSASGVNPLREMNNTQGAGDMGALPDVYPGYQAVADAKVKGKFEKAWGGPLSSSAGMSIGEIIQAAAKGKIKAMYLIGENPLLDKPDTTRVEEALNKLNFLVVQDMFLSETAKLADVVLPGVSFAEKDGTFTNTERRVQRVRRAVAPVGESCADWEIICQVAKKMGGSGFDFKNASQIMDEIAAVIPSYGGINYKRLEKGGLQWPCPNPEHPGTPILYTQQFARGKGRFIPLSTR